MVAAGACQAAAARIARRLAWIIAVIPLGSNVKKRNKIYRRERARASHVRWIAPFPEAIDPQIVNASWNLMCDIPKIRYV